MALVAIFLQLSVTKLTNILRIAHMKVSLKPGIKYECKLMVTDAQTVPAIYPEPKEAAARPEVFATGFLVGFLELACVKAIASHLDWPEE